MDGVQGRSGRPPERAQGISERARTGYLRPSRDHSRLCEEEALPKDVAFLVEVADTTLRKDRKALRRFAWARIPAVWIVNLSARTVEVYSGPTGPRRDSRYAALRTFAETEEIPVILDGREVGRIAVAAILP